MDGAVARQAMVESMWVKTHHGTLLNECADQLTTRTVAGRSFGPEIASPKGRMDGELGSAVSDNEITESEECEDEDQHPPGAIGVDRMGVAVEEQLEHQEDRQRKCLLSRTVELWNIRVVRRDKPLRK
jgi:hypothetical protein